MIGYIVSSNKDYYLKTLPRLLGSMIFSSYINPENIHVFVGRSVAPGCEFDLVHAGVNIHYLSWGAFEHTALIGAVRENLKHKYVFLLQDTCEVESWFHSRVRDGADLQADMTVVNWAMCGFGLYSMDFLRTHQTRLEALVGCDKHTAMVHEGFLAREGLGSVSHYLGEQYKPGPVSDVYGTGQPRLIEEYPCVGLKKFKANYGQTNPSNYVVNL